MAHPSMTPEDPTRTQKPPKILPKKRCARFFVATVMPYCAVMPVILSLLDPVLACFDMLVIVLDRGAMRGRQDPTRSK